MEKYLVFPDGSKFRLVDITLEEFTLTEVWSGSNDTEWIRYKMERNMHSLDEFEDLIDAKVVLMWGGRELVQEDIFKD